MNTIQAENDLRAAVDNEELANASTSAYDEEQREKTARLLREDRESRLATEQRGRQDEAAEHQRLADEQREAQRQRIAERREQAALEARARLRSLIDQSYEYRPFVPMTVAGMKTHAKHQELTLERWRSLTLDEVNYLCDVRDRAEQLDYLTPDTPSDFETAAIALNRQLRAVLDSVLPVPAARVAEARRMAELRHAPVTRQPPKVVEVPSYVPNEALASRRRDGMFGGERSHDTTDNAALLAVDPPLIDTALGR